MTIFNIPYLIKIYAAVFLCISCTGLVIGAFEFAFKRTHRQITLRMFLHLAAIPIGVYLSRVTLNENYNKTMTAETIAMLSLCILTVGTIGYNIGLIEIGTIPLTGELVQRMGIYILLIILGIVFFPFNL